jgi:DNA invertase Pin-like site-specific DNA recombinase
MVSAALSGRFDLVLAESMDRLARSLEETARLYNQLSFVSVKILTLSEGPVSEINVSIGGLLGELYVKNLADKTRRGLLGRVEAGKSAGGRSFGYDLVGGVGANGAPITGELRINPDEAAVAQEILRRFASGEGPRAIARDLNARGVPGPGGRPWGDTTIRGHAKKGTGLINNELYVGRRIWNRSKWIKNPDTGRRVQRLNKLADWTVHDVPHLRIIDEELWQAVKRRQGEVVRPRTDRYTTNPLNDQHRPRFLLSGLLTCGTCGGGYTIRAKDRYGCATRGRQGTCSNAHTITRQELERRVLDGLRSSLLTPELVAEFITEYQREWNRLQSQRGQEAVKRDRRLVDVRRRIAGLVDGIERGIITATTKERLEALEAEKAELEQTPVEQPLPSIHPNLAELYRGKVARLEEELADPEVAADAQSLLRSMISAIVITPGAKRGEVALELHGELAGILALTQGQKNKGGPFASRVQVSVVAGARNRHYLLFEALDLPVGGSG